MSLIKLIEEYGSFERFGGFAECGRWMSDTNEQNFRFHAKEEKTWARRAKSKMREIERLIGLPRNVEKPPFDQSPEAAESTGHS